MAGLGHATPPRAHVGPQPGLPAIAPGLQSPFLLLSSWGLEWLCPGPTQGTELMAQAGVQTPEWVRPGAAGPWGGCPVMSCAPWPLERGVISLFSGRPRPGPGAQPGWSCPDWLPDVRGEGSGVLSSELGGGRNGATGHQPGVCRQSAPPSGWSRTTSRTTRFEPPPCCATAWAPSGAGSTCRWVLGGAPLPAGRLLHPLSLPLLGRPVPLRTTTMTGRGVPRTTLRTNGSRWTPGGPPGSQASSPRAATPASSTSLTGARGWGAQAHLRPTPDTPVGPRASAPCVAMACPWCVHGHAAHYTPLPALKCLGPGEGPQPSGGRDQAGDQPCPGH